MFGPSQPGANRSSQITTLLYGLDQAAVRLGLSETVLVRLSQYFRTPQSAYEDVGSLSFKGELLFSDADLLFFSRVRDRIVMGDSLETIKSQVRRAPADAHGLSEVSPAHAPSQVSPRPVFSGAFPWAAAGEALEPAPAPLPAPPLRELGRQSFARYKQTRAQGGRAIFAAMANRLGGAASADGKPAVKNASRVFSVGVLTDTLRELFPKKPVTEDPMAMGDLGLDPRYVYARGRVWPRQQSPNEACHDADSDGRPLGSPLSVRRKAPALAALSDPSGLSEPAEALKQAALRLREKALRPKP